MARKKDIIQKEWDKVQNALDIGVKKCSGKSFTDKELADVESNFEKWNKLLAEAQKKIASWKKEKDSKRLEWMRFVKTQGMKMAPHYVKSIDKFQKRKEAMAALMEILKNSAEFNLDNADKALVAAQQAVNTKKPRVAIDKYNLGQNKLKAALAYVTVPNLRTLVKTQTARLGLKPSDIDLTDKAYKKKTSEVKSRYLKLVEDFESIEEAVDEMADELDNREPETSSKDPTYKANLKKMLNNYKGVVTFAKKGLVDGKKQLADVGKLEAILKKTEVGNAGALVQGVVKVYKAMHKAYSDVDGHIQSTIREANSTYVKLAKEWDITTEDKTKVLKTPMNRAFGYNYQLKAVCGRGDERLEAILESLVEQFDTSDAKVALRLFN